MPGNPVLSAPNGKKMEQALEGIDFYLALDIYINESTRHADLILPSPSGLETDHYDLVFNAVIGAQCRQIFGADPATQTRASLRLGNHEGAQLTDWETWLSQKPTPQVGQS